MSIDAILERISNTPLCRDTELLRELVATIRPKRSDNINEATDRLHALCFRLSSRPAWASALRNYLFEIVSTRKSLHIFTDTGITLSDGFWGAAWERIFYRILPPLVNDDYLRDVFGTIFDHNDDYRWINGVDEKVWLSLFNALGFRVRQTRLKQHELLNELFSAMQVLSYRISAIGLEPELVRNYPAIERYESPFLRQNDEISEYIKEYRAWLNDRCKPRRDGQHIEVLLSQCEDIVVKIRRTATQQGVSVSLTRLLLRLTQSMLRLRSMLSLIESNNKRDTVLIAVRLFNELVFADNHKYSISNLIDTNTNLLTLQVTEHAGRSGEHYVANNRREWLSMLRSACGAGFIVGFMGTIKILFGKLLVAPFAYAFLFSLNYSFGFMLVHILHFTIATKQPAMTAALIAKSLDKDEHKLDDLVELVVQVIRTQFIEIIGNIALAFPTAYLIAWAWYGSTGHHLVDVNKAFYLIEELNPFTSLALFHAAIAGVWLFLAGLISGYYDNKASYSNIPKRLLQLKSMRHLFGATRWKRITDYIGRNLGALSGNFFFGIMLGSTGQIGIFLGLPIDIRHITFSSANFAFALVGSNHQLGWQVLLITLIGIAMIGITNLAVSFSLALMVALRSRNISFIQGRALIGLLFKRFIAHGRDFFVPPKEAVTPENPPAENKN